MLRFFRLALIWALVGLAIGMINPPPTVGTTLTHGPLVTPTPPYNPASVLLTSDAINTSCGRATFLTPTQFNSSTGMGGAAFRAMARTCTGSRYMSGQADSGILLRIPLVVSNRTATAIFHLVITTHQTWNLTKARCIGTNSSASGYCTTYVSFEVFAWAGIFDNTTNVTVTGQNSWSGGTGYELGGCSPGYLTHCRGGESVPNSVLSAHSTDRVVVSAKARLNSTDQYFAEVIVRASESVAFEQYNAAISGAHGWATGNFSVYVSSIVER
jgi:hypothetical protein